MDYMFAPKQGLLTTRSSRLDFQPMTLFLVLGVAAVSQKGIFVVISYLANSIF